MAEPHARPDGTNRARMAHKGNPGSSYRPSKHRLGEISQIAARLAEAHARHVTTEKPADEPNSVATVRPLSSMRPQPDEFGLLTHGLREIPTVRARRSMMGRVIVCIALFLASLVALVRMEWLPHRVFWDRPSATSQFALASDSVKEGLAERSESPMPRLLVQDAHGTIAERANSALPLQPSTAEMPRVVTADPTVGAQGSPVLPTTSYAISDSVSAPSQLSSEELAMLVDKGKRLIASGDVAAARVVLRRAAESSDAAAALMLGSTYDPVVLRQLNVRGLAADIETARNWYKRANELGSPEASRRLEALVSAEKG
jgi:TPR repeat protein